MTNEIAHLRAALKMSRTDFGLELGVVRTTVMRWEKGEKQPRGYVKAALQSLADRHGVKWPPRKRAA